MILAKVRIIIISLLIILPISVYADSSKSSGNIYVEEYRKKIFASGKHELIEDVALIELYLHLFLTNNSTPKDLAVFHRKYYFSLRKEGFSKDEALMLTSTLNIPGLIKQ